MSALAIKTISAAAAGGLLGLAMVVGVSLPAAADTCVTANPTVVATPTEQSGAAGDTLSYSLSVTNNDSAGCQNSNFAFYQYNTPFGWAASISPAIINDVAPQQTVATDAVYTSDQSAAAGAYDLRVDTYKYTDSTPATQVAITNLTYNVTGGTQPDTVAPVVTITSPTNNANVKKGTTVYIFSTANDNVGVTGLTYQVDGQTVCSGNTGTACAWQVPNRRGTSVITVTASDAAGNSGSASISVNVR